MVQVHLFAGGTDLKRVCFFSEGHYHEGVLVEPGVLLDESHQQHQEEQVIFLPPVVPHTVIGLALNFADHAAELQIATPEEPALFFIRQGKDDVGEAAAQRTSSESRNCRRLWRKRKRLRSSP